MSGNSATYASDAIALTRTSLRASHVFALSLTGSPGAGKTRLLEETLRRLAGDFRTGVIVANPKADRDIERLRALASFVAGIRSAELTAAQVTDVLALRDLHGLDVLFIEALGGIADRAPADLGQDVRVAVFSVAAGDDKAAEFPRRVASADLLLLNKADLLPHVEFDPQAFLADARRVNPTIKVIEVSAAQGAGLDEWEEWLRDAIRRHRPRDGSHTRPSESFLG